MPDADPYANLKTMAEEDAASTDLDALTPEPSTAAGAGGMATEDTESDQAPELPGVAPTGQPQGVIANTLDIAKGIGRGAIKAVESAGNTIGDLGSAAERLTPHGDGSAFSDLQKAELPAPAAPDTTLGRAAEGVAKFTTDFVLMGKALKAAELLQGAGKLVSLARGTAETAGTDFAANDPTTGNLSSLVLQHVEENSWLRNPLTEFLATNPDDSNALNRFKNSVEGFLVGAPLNGLMAAAGALRKVASAQTAGGVEAGNRELITQSEELERSLSNTVAAPEGGIPVFKAPAPSGDPLKDAVDDYFKSAERPDTVWNQDQIKGPDEMRAVLEAIGQKASDKVDLKTVQPLADLEAMANEIGTSSTDVSAAIGEMAKNADQANAIIFAARKQQNAIANEIVKEARLAQTSGGPKDRLNSLVGQLQSLQESLLPVRRAQGRGLRAWGRIADDSFSMQQIQAIIASGGNPASIRKVVQARTLLEKGWGAYMNAWTNGLLSSPATHERNIVGNLTNMLFKPAMRLAGSAMTLDKPGMLESLSHFTGLYKGFADSFSLMAKAFSLNEPILTGSVKSEVKATEGSAKALGLEPTTILGRTVDAINSVVNLPNRFLTAADEFGTQINYRAARYAALTREAGEKGLVGTPAAKYVEDGLNASFEGRTVNGQTFQGGATDAGALDYALNATFKEQPGPLGQGVLNLARQFPPIRLVVPFIKTLSNMTRQAVEFGPGALLSTHWHADIAAGGLRRKEAIAKLTLGTGASYMVMSHVATGQLTGSGPHDPGLRKQLMATGWRPYSVKIGNDYLSYLSLGHVGTMMAMCATLGERMSQYDENQKSSFAAHAVSSFADAMASQSFAQGFSNAVEAMKDDNSMQRFLQSQAASNVPAIVNDLREGTDTTKRSPQDFGEAFLNRLPWFSHEVPAAYNTLGEKVQLATGIGPEEFAPWVNAMTIHSYSARKGDGPLEEMARLQKPFDGIPRFLNLNGQQTDLTGFKNDKGQNAYDRWNELLTTQRAGGGPHGGGGRTLREALQSLIDSPSYKALPDDVRPGYQSERQVQIQNTLAGYRRETEGQLDKEFPALRQAKTQARVNAAAYQNKGPSALAPLLGQQP